MTRMKLDILVISEVTQRKRGSFIYSRGSPAEKGVGAMFIKNLKTSVIGYWNISDRVSLTRLRGRSFNMNIIQVIAPIAEYEDDQAESQCKEHEVTMVIGDLNANVGEGRVGDIVGSHGLGSEMKEAESLLIGALTKGTLSQILCSSIIRDTFGR